MAVAEGLRRALSPRRSVVGYDRSVFGTFDEFDTIHPELRRTICLDPTDLDPDADLVTGHMALSTLRARFREHRRFTILREPRSRLLSLWLYWRALPSATLSFWGTWAERARQSHRPLLDFLTVPEVACQTDNQVTRLLLWPHELIPDWGFIPRDADAVLLDAARRALSTLDYVGLSEDPDLDRRVGDFLGSAFSRPRVNETPSLKPEHRPVLAHEMNVPTLEALFQRTRLDAALWSEVVRAAMPRQNPLMLGEQAFLGNLFRYIGTSTATAVAAQGPPDPQDGRADGQAGTV
ncbi:MAG TPA: hypothetical protein VE033_16700 [Acetobacteraceae bacterium]|nr:hypothetical protein [Acetobacteraceae bacterium]